MSGKKNRFGLGRKIPRHVERDVRVRCGFGCVLCGSPLGYQYHHFDPPFCEARAHNAEGITLLCRRCHGGEGGIISTKDVIEANAHPRAIERGFAEHTLIGGFGSPAWRLGSSSFAHSPSLRIGRMVVGKIEPPEEGSKFFRLSLDLCDPDGGELFSMVRNEVKIGVNRFDITYTESKILGGVIEIHNRKREKILELRIRSSEFIDVHVLRSKVGSQILEIDGEGLAIKTGRAAQDDRSRVRPSPQNSSFQGAIIENCTFAGAQVGIHIGSNASVHIRNVQTVDVKNPFEVEE